MNIGTILLLLVIVVELVFAGYCFVTRESQRKLRIAIKLGYFLLFLIGLLLSTIEWSFRWYLFGILLLVQAVIGVVALVKGTPRRKEFRSVHVVRNFIITAFLYVICLCPVLLFPQYHSFSTTGSYDVNTVSYTYVDKSRTETYTDNQINRKLNVAFWYPENKQSKKDTFPLIIFSHGAMGIKSSNLSLYKELASNGYIVCAIDHSYQCLYTIDENGEITLLSNAFMRELMKEDVKENIENSYNSYQKWMSILTGDINFVLDTILEKSSNNLSDDNVYTLVDSSKISVMGHSLGGAAALGIGRSRNDIKAVIALESPYMYDIIGIKDKKFIWNEKEYPIPVLNIYSDSSWSHLSEWPQYAENASLLSDKKEDVYNVHMKGANHFSLTDLSLKSPFLTSMLGGMEPTIDTEYCLKTMNQICLEFFNHYLKNENDEDLLVESTYCKE